jgi:hypothetical protein
MQKIMTQNIGNVKEVAEYISEMSTTLPINMDSSWNVGYNCHRLKWDIVTVTVNFEKLQKILNHDAGFKRERFPALLQN